MKLPSSGTVVSVLIVVLFGGALVTLVKGAVMGVLDTRRLEDAVRAQGSTWHGRSSTELWAFTTGSGHSVTRASLNSSNPKRTTVQCALPPPADTFVLVRAGVPVLPLGLGFELPAQASTPPPLAGTWDVYAAAEVSARRLTPAVTSALQAVTATGVEVMVIASGRSLELRVPGGTSAPEQVFALVGVCRAFTQP